MEASFASNPRTVRDGESPRNVHVESRARNVLRNSGRSLQARYPTEKLTTREITQAVTETLHAVPTKVLADATGGSLRAAQNVREGLNGMSLTAFVNACRAIPELKALALEMLDCEAVTDPDFVKGITLLMNSYVRKQMQGEESNSDA